MPLRRSAKNARPLKSDLGPWEEGMNVFEEFKRLVSVLEKEAVRYALVGGVAMPFYTEPRFTRDIDLLVDCEDFDKTKAILEKAGYFESLSPRTFPEVAIELHRFLKVAGVDDEMLINVLVAKSEEVRRIVRNAVGGESEEERVMIANRRDLIWLKRTRDSNQDQADIEKLEGTRRERFTTSSCEELSGSRSFGTTRIGIPSSPGWVEFWPRRELIASPVR